MAADQSFECNAPDVIFEDFGDETILINLQTGHYYSLDPSAMALWDLLSQGVATHEVVEHVEARHPDDDGTIARSIDELVTLLVTEQLLRPATRPRPLSEVVRSPSAAPDGAPAGGAETGTAFVPPVLAKYDDMAEMLLLDPIHDVADQGWPEVEARSPDDADG